MPSLILSTDTTSGMYRIGANNIGISISAAKVLDISSTGLSVTGALSASGGYNGSVGATTPSTVAATTLSASGQATLSTTLLVGSGATLTGSGVEVQAANFQIIGRSSSTTRMMLAHDGTKGKIGTLDNQSFDFLVNNAIIGTASSTGLNSTAIGATTPSTGAFTTLGAKGLLTVVRSDSNNSVQLDSETGEGHLIAINPNSAVFPAFLIQGRNNVPTTQTYGTFTSTGLNSTAIGATTPSTGAFTTLSSTGNTTVDSATTANLILDRGSASDYNQILFRTAGANTGGWDIFGSNTTNQSLLFYSYQAGGTVGTFSSTGLAVTGALSSTGALAIGNTVNTVSPTSPNRTVTIVIGGTTYYLAAKTTND